MGRPALWPPIGTEINCFECKNKFVLSNGQRDRMRMQPEADFFCTHKCLGKRNGREKTNAAGWKESQGYLRKTIDGRRISRHVFLAEQALGKKLPKGAQVHHVNGDTNNEHPSLVICPSRGYHILLHARQRALDECGNANWIRCRWCKKYSPKEEVTMIKINGIISERVGVHRACARIAAEKYKHK